MEVGIGWEPKAGLYHTYIGTEKELLGFHRSTETATAYLSGRDMYNH